MKNVEPTPVYAATGTSDKGPEMKGHAIAGSGKTGRSGGLLSSRPQFSSAIRKRRRKFLHYFPEGFRDETYVDWERGYKWEAHKRWEAALGEKQFRVLLKQNRHADVAAQAVSIESHTNLLFSFEKMALRDAIKSPRGAKAFANAAGQFCYHVAPCVKALQLASPLLDALERGLAAVRTLRKQGDVRKPKNKLKSLQAFPQLPIPFP